MIGTEDIRLMEGYLTDSLSEEELAQVRERLANDDEYQAFFDQMSLMTQAIKRSAERSTVEEKLEKLRSLPIDHFFEEDPDVPFSEGDQDTKAEAKVWSLTRRKMLGSALAAAMLALVYFVFLASPSTETPEDLYASHFEPLTSRFSQVRGNVDDLYRIRSEAHRNYRAADYASALQQFDRVFAQEEYFPSDLEAAAIAHMQLGQWTSAEQLWERLRSLGGTDEETATWYLALSDLAQGRAAPAKDKLHSLAQSDRYSRQASRMLKKLP